MNLFNLFATLTLDNSDYEKKLDQSQKSAGSFSSKIGTAFKTGVRAVAGFVTGVAAVSAAIGALVVKFVDAGSEIDDNAQKLGISTEAYQYWSLVLQRAGADASNLSIAIRNMSTFTQELAEGNGEALLTLQKLGIGYEDFMSMNTEEQLYAIVNALQGMEDQTEKVQIAQEIFGNRVYQELLPLLNMEQGSLEELRSEFEGLGLIMSEDTIKSIAAVGDKLDNLGNLFKITGLSIAADFLPEINNILDAFTALVTGSSDVETAMHTIADSLVSVLTKVLNAAPDILDAAGNLLINIVVGLTNAISNTTFIKDLTNFVISFLAKIVEIIPTLVGSVGEIVVALINALIRADWGTLIINLVEAIFDIGFVQLPSIIVDLMTTLLNAVFDLFFTKEGQKALAEFGINLAEAIINSLISGVENGVNLLVDGINGLLDGLSGIWTWIGIPEIPDIPHASFPRVDFAEGGMFPSNMGTLYALAGEAGAEIVAHGSRGTGVANIEQIADAQYMAMQDYNLRGIIQDAAVAIVNGIVAGLGRQEGNTEITVRIGDKDFNSYVVNTVNNTLRSQGRKSLRTVTAYK